MRVHIKRFFAIAGLAIILGVPSKSSAVPMSVPWTSTTFTANADSRAGDISNFASVTTTPVPATVQDAQTATGPALPQATPATSVVINDGFPNERKAFAGAGISGSAAGIMTVASSGFTTASDRTDVTTHGAGATGTTTFIGEFISNGTSLDLAFDGDYNLSAFGANNQGFSLGRQFAFAAIQGTYLVEDLTVASILLSDTLMADSRAQQACGSVCLPTRINNALFSGSRSIDLAGTTGNSIKVTVSAVTRTFSYAGHESFDNSGQATKGVASASFGSPSFGGKGFNYSFTTEEGVIPEPSTLTLAALGLLAMVGRRRSRA